MKQHLFGNVAERVAVALLDKARERYDRERQPEVLRRAGEVLSVMTDGRYVDVRNPLGGSGFTVVSSEQTLRTTAELSRGAAEQLYLALRLAYIESLGDRAPALPVLMDDILVNFDDDRATQAALSIEELAQTCQVIYFTCHPTTPLDAELEVEPGRSAATVREAFLNLAEREVYHPNGPPLLSDAPPPGEGRRA